MATGSSPSSGSGSAGKRQGYWIAIIGGVFAVLAALAGGLTNVYHAWPWSSNSSCRIPLQISLPRGGTHVSGSKGVEVEGNACDMTGKTGWLFDYDFDDHYYYMDYPGDSTKLGPIVAGDGSWAYDDQPIGSPGDYNQTYGLAIVQASQECASELQKARPDSTGDIRFSAFPLGCQVDDINNVIVTYP